jgi:2-oxo-hept-3-ene-1,7-dioate hydratase
MTLQPEDIDALAEDLRRARITKQPAERFTARHPAMTIGDAYAVQSRWLEGEIAAGRRLVGRKIGLTSRVMQRATGITEPDYGVILDDVLVESGCRLDHGEFLQPRVEVELAFVLRSPVRGPRATALDILRATEFVIPALELLDSRLQMEGRTVVDTISDNAACAGAVTGGRASEVHAIDLRRSGAILYRNGAVEDTGLAAGVMDNPAASVAWLVNKLCEHGAEIQPGEVVLAGSFTAPMWVNKGDTVTADFGPLGTVGCSFQ